jgi:hypothetical protein
MCIISQPVKEVESTKILVAIGSDQSRQMIVYSNRVDNEISTNAMILPVPNPKTIKFHDLSKHKDIFKDLDSVFKSFITMNSLSYSSDSFARNQTLKVFDVGSYQVSLAYSVNDILKVNQDVFQLSPGCYDLLKSSYTANFGFIICKLKQGDSTYHPLGYSHQIINKTNIFIPTKHYHEHVSLDDIEYQIEETNKDEKWSHNIYLYNCKGENNLIKSMGMDHIWNTNNPLLFNYNDIEFDFGHCKNLEKYTIKGEKPNIDLVVSV